ncbi:MAG: FMN-binding protein [Planctomycetes bacterium]|nr:FMN-binding protein [Planctomycetota bacterium]
MTEKKWFPIIYMFIITAVFSFVLIGFTNFTSARVAANQRLAFEKAVLAVLPGLYPEGEKISSLDLHQRFVDKVLPPDETSGGAYTLRDSGKLIAYALPISGRGFWAEIKGVIGISADQKTITAVSFYQQNETPGLGAEIAKPEFRKQFHGKVILFSDKPLAFKRPGEQLDAHSINAVTGATQTCTRLEKIINDALINWQKQVKPEP